MTSPQTGPERPDDAPSRSDDLPSGSSSAADRADVTGRPVADVRPAMPDGPGVTGDHPAAPPDRCDQPGTDSPDSGTPWSSATPRRAPATQPPATQPTSDPPAPWVTFSGPSAPTYRPGAPGVREPPAAASGRPAYAQPVPPAPTYDRPPYAAAPYETSPYGTPTYETPYDTPTYEEPYDTPTYDSFYRTIYGEAPTSDDPGASQDPGARDPEPATDYPPPAFAPGSAYPMSGPGYPAVGPGHSAPGYPYPAGPMGYPVPTSPPREVGLAMLLTAVGFFGVAGLQYFYIGKIGKGVGYLLTAGWLGIGTIVSLFTIGDETERTNDERRRGLR